MSANRILIFDAEALSLPELPATLCAAGMTVTLCGDFARTLTLAGRGAFDLAVLHLSNQDHLALIDVLTRKGIPSLIATSGAADTLRIDALKRGAGDHLLPPFDVAQVVSRLGTLQRPAAIERRRQRWMLDVDSGRFGVGSRVVWLTAAERRTVAVLLKHKNRAVPKPVLKSTLADGADLSDSAVGVAIHRLRAKLSGIGVTIRARRGEGYVLEESH